MLIVVDGPNISRRHYHGNRSTRIPAVYGTMIMLERLLMLRRPAGIVVAWEGGNDTRRALHPGYKERRSATPDDYAEQVELLMELLTHLGMQQVRSPGNEADDAMATLARVAHETGHECLILSGDGDMLQCLTPDGRVRVLKPINGGGYEEIDHARATEMRGVEPERLREMWALTGQPKDDIPGIRGIGPKGAMKLFDDNDVKTVKELLDKGNDIVTTPAKRSSLMENKEQVMMARDLLRLRDDCKLEPVMLPIKNVRQAGTMLDELGIPIIATHFCALIEGRASMVATDILNIINERVNSPDGQTG